jgi:predicted Zn-dependent protease with MMP-like domain
MEREDFELLVAEGYERLPQWVRNKIKNVALLVEDDVSNEDRIPEGLTAGQTLLGLYKGVPLSKRGDGYGIGMTMPDTITLYRLPILRAASEEQKPVSEIVADTVWHEFAHHFGMTEKEVRAREAKRKNA